MPVEEGNHTTHFSVVDAAGNAVALTTTINELFGSAVTVAGAGFLLNDEMDDFTAKPGEPNLFGLVQGEAERDRAGQADAVRDDADDRARRRRPAVARHRRARRAANHHRGVPGPLQRRGPRDGRWARR